MASHDAVALVIALVVVLGMALFLNAHRENIISNTPTAFAAAKSANACPVSKTVSGFFEETTSDNSTQDQAVITAACDLLRADAFSKALDDCHNKSNAEACPDACPVKSSVAGDSLGDYSTNVNGNTSCQIKYLNDPNGPYHGPYMQYHVTAVAFCGYRCDYGPRIGGSFIGSSNGVFSTGTVDVSTPENH